MSFVKLGSFLVRAFERIDHKNNLKEKKYNESVEGVLQEILSGNDNSYSAELRGGVLTFFTSSQVLKQKVQLMEHTIKKEIQKKFPTINISRINFKGPRG